MHKTGKLYRSELWEYFCDFIIFLLAIAPLLYICSRHIPGVTKTNMQDLYIYNNSLNSVVINLWKVGYTWATFSNQAASFLKTLGRCLDTIAYVAKLTLANGDVTCSSP